MCAKVCLRVDFESVLAHFEFKLYQSKRKINFAMYQSKKTILQCIRENFVMYQRKFYNVWEKILQCIRKNFYNVWEKILQCIRKNFYNVSEQVKNKFKMYQSKLNFLRCIKVNKISKDVSEQVGILKYIRACLNF